MDEVEPLPAEAAASSPPEPAPAIDQNTLLAAEATRKASDAETARAKGRQLRRLLDENLEAELADAMAQFEGGSLPNAPRQQVAGPTQPTAAPGARGGGPQKRSVRVLSVRGQDVYVDLGEKSEGVVPLMQFEGKVPQPGDALELVLDRYDQQNDLHVMRRPGTAQEADWGSVAKGMVVDAQVKKVNKGGLEVTVNGIRGFMPAGQTSLSHIADLSVFVGKTLRSVVSEVNLSSRNLIVSHKAVLEREREEQAQTTLAKLEVGQVYEGVVKSVRDFGVFVDIGGVDGLVHVSQLSWQRIRDPGELVRAGDPMKVVVLAYDPETKKISLGARQLTESPWTKAAANYPVGAVVSGVVTRLAEFGAFVELEPGLEGLVHVSELSRNKVFRVNNVVREGERVDVKVLECDVEKKRLSLSRKAVELDAEAKKAAEKAAAAESAADAEADAAVAAPKKPRTTPLKGGLGGGGPLFG